MGDSFDTLTLIASDELAIITMNRPKVKNAINLRMLDELGIVLHQVKSAPNIKALIITGGDSDYFSSGGDVKEFHQYQSQEEVSNILEKANDILSQLEQFPLPTIAALNGNALGGACELALACDFRIAHPQIKLGFIQIIHHIMTSWGGGTRLIRLLGKNALPLLLSGKLIPADEAQRLGLLDRLLPQEGFLEAVMAYVRSMTVHQRESILAYMKLYRTVQRGEDYETCLQVEREEATRLWIHPNHRMRIEAFLQKKL
ncbi:enoyl-CoA hydratase/isomerase family protein [Rubeoparvulum massiliense]|uniref:enoyl-CoA hydratase/isomerase family protein n=1 Tax=Rubeoparvulum massiliense TaxID=1631346 RepID=UPI00065E576B|nr:enoyl-CoA hydratase/isomerase family protein [Rubeoparvulum massiliense]